MSLKRYSYFIRWCIFNGHEYIKKNFRIFFFTFRKVTVGGFVKQKIIKKSGLTIIDGNVCVVEKEERKAREAEEEAKKNPDKKVPLPQNIFIQK